MSSRLSIPHVLPLTIVVMLLLLFVKAATFARDATAEMGSSPATVTRAPSITPPITTGPASITPIIKQNQASQESDPEKALLQDLRKRREELDARARNMEERSSVIAAAEANLQAKIDRLTALQRQMDQQASARKTRQDANWTGLVKVYESMKPHDAATIFDVLDMHVLLEVIDRMNSRKAAAILAAMQPQRARMVTQMLAQMRLQQEVPTIPRAPAGITTTTTAEK